VRGSVGNGEWKKCQVAERHVTMLANCSVFGRMEGHGEDTWGCVQEGMGVGVGWEPMRGVG